MVYQKDIFVTDKGKLNLVRLLYEDKESLGTAADDFEGGRRRMSRCFAGEGTPRVFLYEADSLRDVLTAKDRLSSLFRVGNHSVHINDYHQETERLAQSFFNENSIHHLNHARLGDQPNFLSLLQSYEEWIVSCGVDREELCVVSGGVLAAYGIRDCGDFEVIHRQITELPTLPAGVRSRNANSAFYDHAVGPRYFRLLERIILY